MNSDFEDERTQGDLQSKGLFGQLQARLGRSWYWASFQYGTVKARIYKDTKQTQTQEGAVRSIFC